MPKCNVRIGRVTFLLASILIAALTIAARLALAGALIPGVIISQIRIEGNERVETDAIRIHISQRAGQPLDVNAVDADVKAIFKMHFFEDVSPDLETVNGANVLIYRVKEEPQISEVRFEGMKAIRSTDDKIVAAVKVHAGAILDPVREKESINEITRVYQDKGYLDVKVLFRAILEPDNTAAVVFDVNEGPKVEIASIEFRGNHAFSDRQLRAVMDTGTHNFLSFVTNAGALDNQRLSDDVAHLSALYYDSGYLNVYVQAPQITRIGNMLKIVIDIDEGAPYRIGRVAVAGNLKFPRSELTRLLTIKPGQLFEGSTLQHDLISLSEFYSNRGYAFVNVLPRTQLEPQAQRVDVTFYVDPGHEVLINRINVTGNTNTSDKVIRRELRIQEQEPYSAQAIRESKQRLDRLGFFSDTSITTEPGTQPDKIDLDVNVTEKNTALLSVSGGFDSYSSVFGNFTLGNTNLFGGGESLVLGAQVGTLFQNYSLSYTEPWFLDMPLRVGLQLFDTKQYLTSFNQAAAGFALNTQYPLAELGLKNLGSVPLNDVTAGLGYQFESVGITGLNSLTTFDILRYKGYTQTSEILPSIQRFTVDDPIDPRTGTNLSFNSQVGGLGGGNYFLKSVLHWRYFYPFLKSATFGTWVLSQGVTFGAGTNLSSGTGGEMPLYERFFPGGTMGGPGDVRGYQLYSLGPLVTLYNGSGQPVSVQNVGGSKELILSNEITFPILSGLGLRGVMFSDAGQSYMLHENMSPTTLQASYGLGLRWKSPFGLISIDVARPINPRPQDQSTTFEISTGVPL
ncbi:MAG: outer membrane protein assembly factor BamA [Candidatus Binataceae bacterium]